MSTRFTIVGDGAMGTACALLLASKPAYDVTIWCQFPFHCQKMNETRQNMKFLPGVSIPERVRIVDDFSAARDADVFVVAVPTVYLTPTLERLREQWPARQPVVSVVKGMEENTFRSPSQIIGDVLGDRSVVVLSGPSHAEEISRGMPASVVAASGNVALATDVQRWFSTERFRVYTTHDLRGTELAGALKNVIAIAAGVCDGLGFGDNAKSALMTRGLVEMIRFGVAMGAEPKTFYGLAGLGDLITTCISPHGRNRHVGQLLGEGKKLYQILKETEKVAEGIWTARSVHQLAQRKGIDMPVTDQIYQILYDEKNPKQAVADLMTREPKPEW